MNIFASFRDLPLWKEMISKSPAEELAIVERHFAYILPDMEHYVDTFPTYTLHNKEHILNVVRIMGELLGDRIDSIKGIEAAILILSAAYHDYGMVYSEEERSKISTYEDFNLQFLVEQVSAQVMYEEAEHIVTPELAEWYCRWNHANRVWHKLNETESIERLGRLVWNGIPLRHAVANVCQSHNEPAEHIRIDDARFPVDDIDGCDLRFCALLLRLGDILDFDNSRSPQSVYDYLDLGNPKNHSEEISRDEWQKHMASRGFRFLPKPDTKPLKFEAAPPHPFIEQGIRTLLDLIDAELEAAEKVVTLCSERWKTHPFPQNIDRSGIKSVNYLSGKYRFFLSEDKILDLLTGDSLYHDDFVFIRELLQNAIDTVRHRNFIERFDNPKSEPHPIHVSYFKDPDGYYWLRVDDNGMGMNMGIINKFLLNKGVSYYLSDDFKLEKIKIQKKEGKDFIPISRFGIGLLSCFMTCDKIEISTCYLRSQEGQPREKTRLTIEGRSGYWVIKSEKAHHKATKMPSRDRWEDDYRTEPGTSIACRIKTAREVRGLNIARQIDRFLLASEVPIIFEDKPLGGNREEMAIKPWCKPSRTALPQDFVQQCSDLINVKIESIDIEIRPINMTEMSATRNLTGQIVLVIPHIKIDLPPANFNPGSHFNIRPDGKKSFFYCEITEIGPNGNQTRRETSHDITALAATISVPEKLLEYDAGYSQFIWPRVSHNGIVVHDNEHQLHLQLPLYDLHHRMLNRHTINYLSTGLYCFRDSLLPELHVSRSSIKSFTPEMISHIFYATRELNDYGPPDFGPFSYLPDLEGAQRQYPLLYSIGMFDKIELYQKDIRYWNSLPCVSVKGQGLITVDQALGLAKTGPIIFKTKKFSTLFFTDMVKYILLKNLLIRYQEEGDDWYFEGRYIAQNILIPALLTPFQPMKFVEGNDALKPMLKNYSFNIHHPLIGWFLANSQLIEKEYSYFGYQLFNELSGDTPQEDRAFAINEILERLRALLPADARPPADLNVTPDQLLRQGH